MQTLQQSWFQSRAASSDKVEPEGRQIKQLVLIKVLKNPPLNQLLYCIHHVVVNLPWKNFNIMLQVQNSLLAVLRIKFFLYLSLKLYPTSLSTYKPCLYNMASIYASTALAPPPFSIQFKYREFWN
jgi:hypothetical protein